MIRTEHILTLFNLPGIGRKAVSTIVDTVSFHVTSPNELLDLIDEAGKTNKRIKTPSRDDLERALERTEVTMRKCEQGGYSILGFFDKDFPKRYANIPDRPLLLYANGDLSALNTDHAVAIIGTREPTDWGEKAGRRLSTLFTEKGFAIVSGLAKGCDTAAHQGCLDAHGKTVAILGGGIDHIYPKENKPLADKILDTGGCLLSEYEPGMRPQKSSFVERDRLQSGLSQAVIVIETDVKGGSMHTVGFAFEQKRLVACLGGHPDSYQSHPKVQGTKKLILDGKASRLSSPEEIAAFIGKLITPVQESPAPSPNHPTLPPVDPGTQGKLF